MDTLSPRQTHFVVLDNRLFSDDDVYRPLHSVTQFKKIQRAHFWNEYIIQCKPKRMYLFGLEISCALYSRSSGDKKEILQGKTNRAYIFSNFVVLFIRLTVSVHLLLSSMVLWTTWMTNYKGTIAIACCDRKRSKTCTIYFIYKEPCPLPFWSSL